MDRFLLNVSRLFIFASFSHCYYFFIILLACLVRILVICWLLVFGVKCSLQSYILDLQQKREREKKVWQTKKQSAFSHILYNISIKVQVWSVEVFTAHEEAAGCGLSNHTLRSYIRLLVIILKIESSGFISLWKID